MNRPLRRSDLSPARQALVRLCQELNFGHILGLEVQKGEPVLDPPPEVIVDVKLDGDEGSRPELALADFDLRSEVCRLLVRIDGVNSGSIERLEVRHGTPVRAVFRHRPADTTVSVHQP